ncbi:MAG TPA: ribonuclease J, partial [Candidatus Paceibacterota bacterium]|nr:ribonuclease J [Candidatus Paceibacterota bacterium]
MTPAPAPAPAPGPARSTSSNAAAPAKRAPAPRGERPASAHPRGGRNRRGGGGGGSSNRSMRDRRRPGGGMRGAPSAPSQKSGPEYFPEAPGKDVVRIVPLGGVEEVGRNMFTIEANNDIFVFDVGFQFTSEDSSPGVDYLLPNVSYLEKNKDRIKAVFITHGHLDHIGGFPFLMDRIGNPPTYTMNLSAVMIQKRQEEYPDSPKPNLIVVEPNTTHTIGNTKVQFFPVTHSIPDSMGIAVETPYGNVIATGDLKLEHVDGIPVPEEVKKWTALGSQKNLLFIGDSTNAEMEG